MRMRMTHVGFHVTLHRSHLWSGDVTPARPDLIEVCPGVGQTLPSPFPSPHPDDDPATTWDRTGTSFYDRPYHEWPT